MSEERKRILEMLKEGKVSVEEAEKLLRALEDAPRGDGSRPADKRYLRVLVDDPAQEQKVNIRVPMSLIRAGARLSALLPRSANDKIHARLAERGLDIAEISPENLEQIIQALNDVEIDVDGKTRIKVSCE
jgi:hypothetical protein